MSGMSGGSMLRTRRKDVNIKPNRKLDRKSSRGMLYENEELRLRTININAEVERGQTDIKKLKRENDQLKREISALRYEYERLDQLLQERRSSPEHSDDSGSCCSACNEYVDAASAQNDQNATCAARAGAHAASTGLHVAFHDLSVVEEEPAGGDVKSLEGAACSCDTCQEKEAETSTVIPKEPSKPPASTRGMDRGVDVLVHDAPSTYLLTAVASPPPPGFRVSHSEGFPQPPGPGFNINSLAAYNPPPPPPPPRFHTGGNIEDLLGDVQTGPNITTTQFIQQNSVFMCNTRKVTTHKREPCCCQKEKSTNKTEIKEKENEPKYYVTEKNIELTYDYPRTTAIPQRSPSPKQSEVHTTTEEASTVVFVERKIPIRPRGKFDFLFRSRSAPVGENEEPIYATVNKLPKRLRRIELANLENEVAYRTGEPTVQHPDTTGESKEDEPETPISNLADDETSRSEDKPPPTQRPDTPKAKKRRRFSLTFKKRGERKKPEKEKLTNGVPAPAIAESDNERLIEGAENVGVNGNGVQARHQKRCRHTRPRTVASSISSGPRYKRDSYQEMTTSHSEHERTNSISSSINSNCSLATHKSRKLSAPPPDASIPWCGCWGTSCV